MQLAIGITRSRLRKLWYMPLLALAMGLMLARLLVMARILDVPGFAVFSGGLLVSSTYCMLACLGLQSLLQRDMPVLLLRRRERRGVVLLLQCLVVAAACAIVGVAASGAGVAPAGITQAQLLVGLVHGLSQQVFLLATVESRSRGEPLRFAWQNFERALAVLAGGAAVGAWTGSALQALGAEAIVSLVVSAAFLGRQLRVAPLALSAWCRVALQRLPRVQWRSALTLLCVASIGFLLINIDRWIAVRLLPPGAFAQFAFAWTVLMVAQSVQVIINASVYPMLARRFAAHGQRAAFRVAAITSIGLLAAAIVLAVPVWFVLDAAIVRWFPAYADARALLPAFLAIATLRLADFWSSYLVIVGREARLLLLNLAAGAAAFAAWWWVVRPGTHSVAAMDIALLAGLLTASNFLVCAATAWRVGRT